VHRAVYNTEALYNGGGGGGGVVDSWLAGGLNVRFATGAMTYVPAAAAIIYRAAVCYRTLK